MKKRAFSYLEILIIIAIAALTAVLFVPAAQMVREKIRTQTIERQLENIAAVGKQYCADSVVDKVAYKQLKAQNKIEDAVSVLGENYDEIVINVRGGTLSVKTSSGQEIKINY